MILSNWPDSFSIAVHPQLVCDDSQWSCPVTPVDLTISQYLSILSWYVMPVVLNDPVKSTWLLLNLCPSLVCMWWSCQGDLTIPQSLFILSSVYSQFVCDVLNDTIDGTGTTLSGEGTFWHSLDGTIHSKVQWFTSDVRPNRLEGRENNQLQNQHLKTP